MATAFTASTITDQKRYARGEQYRMAKILLQARDEAHQSAWKVLMLSGPEPSGEINAIRTLMPRAVIVAVDQESDYVDRAKAAGADYGVACDLNQLQATPWNGALPCAELMSIVKNLGRFDILHLDFCGLPNHTMRKTVTVNVAHCLSGRGILMLAFSYGRDVEPMFSEAVLKIERSEKPAATAAATVLRHLREKGASRPLANRLAYVLPAFLPFLRSVIQYSGPSMPMASVLAQKRWNYANPRKEDVSFVKASAEEFNLCVTHPDVRTLYDCPEEKLRKIKASLAAQKAVATRRAKAPAPDPHLLVNPQLNGYV